MKTDISQTECGQLPANWSVRTLDDLTERVTNGFVGKAKDHYDESGDGVLYIQGYNVKPNSFDFHGIKRVTREFHERHRKSCLKAGDLLTVQTGDCGVTAIVPQSLEGSNCHALVISRLKKNLAEPAFYGHYFNSERGMRSFQNIETGTTMKHLNVGDMKPLMFPVPPIEEQQAIAEALGDVDALINALDALITKKRNIKQGTMQQLLTGKKRLPGFAQSAESQKTEAGVVPGDWSVKALGSEIEQLEAGVSVKSVDKENGNSAQGSFILKTSAVEAGNFLPHECKRIEPKDTDRAKLNPKANTVLISRMNTIALVGECGYVDRDYANLFVPDRLWMTRFRSDSRISARWLSYVLTTDYYRQKLRTIATGTSGSMKNISKPSLLGLPFAFPHPDEQSAIASVLSDMDSEIAALEQKREKTKLIKQGMMQELLTGKTRLV